MTIDAISTLPSAPDRTNSPETFNADSDAMVAALASMITELNTSISQMNNDFTGTYYDGAWSSASGAKTAPKIYQHNSSLWLLLNSSGDITTTEPAVSNSDYLLIGNSPAGEMKKQTLSGTTPTWTVSTAPFGEITLSGPTTITISGEPAGSVATPLILKVTQDAGANEYSLAFSGATIKTDFGRGLAALSKGASAVDYISLLTDDNGSSYVAKVVHRDVQS